MSKIMTLGEILVEIMATRIGQSFRQPGTLVGPYPSGAPAIFIDQVAKLGHPCAIIGCVGDDDFGRLNTDRLSADGADVSTIQVLPNAVTGSAFVTYKEDGGRDFIFNITNSASAHLHPDLVTEAVLKDCSHFHVMGSSLFSPDIVAAAKKAVSMVKAQGGTISFDPNIRKEILKSEAMREALVALLGEADIFLPSDNELTLLVDAASDELAVARILDMGVSEIILKQGVRGCRYFDAKGSLHVPVVPVEEVDPTGAGDCFGATYITCRKLGKPVDEALRYAVASGARAVTRKGPMEGTSSFAELDALLDASEVSRD